MELLRARDLTVWRGGRRLFAQVDLTLEPGQRLGLVGPNGAGKSTLLELLAGRIPTEDGELRRAPGLRLGYLSQERELGAGTVRQAAERALAHVDSLERALRDEERRLSAGDARMARYAELIDQFEAAGGYEARTRLERSMGALGFGPDAFERPVPQLSGGERARLALALTLADRPEALLLDEPSNHLDIGMRRWLSATLGAYPGSLILASHDRALLDAVVTHTAHLDNGSLTLFRGNYSSMRRQRAQHALTRSRVDKEREKTRERLTESRAKVGVKGRKSLDARIARLEPAAGGAASSQRTGLRLGTREARGTLLHARHLSKNVDGRRLLDDVSLRIGAGDKIALVGPNGIGKSTLLRLLTGDLESDHPRTHFEWGKSAKVAVFDQHDRGLTEGQPIVAQLTRHVTEPRAHMLLALAGLPRETWTRPPEALSGGERARAGLALLMAGEASLLVLDEPTEGLDISAIERLEDALRDTRAAFVLASHDQALVEAVADRVWTIQDAELREFRGGLPGYYGANLRLSVDPEQRGQADVSSPRDEEAPDDALERLELERLGLERNLEDPWLLSERERERNERRYRDVLNELSVLYDARLPAPLPAYGARHGPVEVTADRESPTAFAFGTSTGLGARLVIPGPERIGHLVLIEPEATCVLPWARRRALEAVARIAFERLEVHALQVQTSHDLRPAGFRDAGAGWWLLTRGAYELAAGYGREDPRRRRVRLHFHPDWEDWVAYRRWCRRRRDRGIDQEPC